MTTNVLSVRSTGPNISQRVIETHLDNHPDYTIECRKLEAPKFEIGNTHFLWISKYLEKQHWHQKLVDTIPIYDVVLAMNTIGPVVTTLCDQHNIPSVFFVRSLGCTGLVHYDPNQSKLCNVLRATNGARLQYPFLINHVRSMKHAANQADGLVSNSEYIQQHLQDGFGVDSTIVYPPINLDEYRVSYNPEGKIGMVNPRKRLKGGRVFYELTQALPDEEFVSCGRIEPRDLARKQEQVSNWTHLGWVEDMRMFYERCKVVVVPSQRDEAFGRAAAEPMVSGIPVVASAVGGLMEVVGDTGELVPAGSSVNAWQVAIQNALRDHDPSAQKLRVRRFGKIEQVGRFMTVLQSVL